MMSRLISRLIIAISVLGAFFGLYSLNKTGPQAFYDTLESIIRTEQYDAKSGLVLQKGIDVIIGQMPILKSVVVNKVPQVNQISVVTVEMSKLNTGDNASRLANLCKNNLVAVGDRYIVVDVQFLKMLSQLIANEIVSTANALEHVDNEMSLEKRKQVATTYAHVQMYQLHAISYFVNKDFFGLDEDTTPDNALDSLHMFASISDSPPFDLYLSKFASALAPFLLHEIGHIRNGTSGLFLDGPATLVDRAVLELIRMQEEEADSFAMQIISTHLALSPVQGAPITLGFSASEGLHFAAELLAHSAFCHRFLGFRNLYVSSIGSHMAYLPENECYFDDMRLTQQQCVASIRETLFPILTDDEFRQFQGNDSSLFSTHRNPFERSVAFATYANDYVTSLSSGLTTHSSSVRGLLSSDISLVDYSSLRNAYVKDVLRIYPGMMKRGIYIENDFFDSLVRLGFVSCEPYAHPFDNCIILKHSNGMYIEFGLNSSNIVYASLYIPYFSILDYDIDGETPQVSERSVKTFALKLQVLQLILSRLSNNDFSVSSPEFSKYLFQHAKYMYASYGVDFRTGTCVISPYGGEHKNVYMTFVLR